MLSSLPVFYLSFFKAPVGFINSCHLIVREFLWGGTYCNAKIAWVNWDTLCKRKEERGLGIKDWGRFNLALLGKWRWRFLNERGSLWHNVLLAKYSHRSILKPSVWWQDLKKVWTVMIGGLKSNWQGRLGMGEIFYFGQICGLVIGICVINSQGFSLCLLNRDVGFVARWKLELGILTCEEN